MRTSRLGDVSAWNTDRRNTINFSTNSNNPKRNTIHPNRRRKKSGDAPLKVWYYDLMDIKKLDIKRILEKVEKDHEDLKAGRLIGVELGSDEFYEIFNKLPRPKTLTQAN